MKKNTETHRKTDATNASAAGGNAPRGALPPAAGGREPSDFSPPDPEVPTNKVRRKFTAKYKLRILEEADACTEPGRIGALLRREGLYSSNLTAWRRQREKGLPEAMKPKKRGCREKAKNPLAEEMARLENENRRLKEKLGKAETIIDVQKKISELMDRNPFGNGRNI